MKTFPGLSSQIDIVGRMYLYNVTAKTAWELKLDSKKLNARNFFPHGISIYKEIGKFLKIDIFKHFRPYCDVLSEEQLLNMNYIKSYILCSIALPRTSIFPCLDVC